MTSLFAVEEVIYHTSRIASETNAFDMINTAVIVMGFVTVVAFVCTCIERCNKVPPVTPPKA